MLKTHVLGPRGVASICSQHACGLVQVDGEFLVARVPVSPGVVVQGNSNGEDWRRETGIKALQGVVGFFFFFFEGV